MGDDRRGSDWLRGAKADRASYETGGALVPPPARLKAATAPVRMMQLAVSIALWAPLLALSGGCGGAITTAATKSTTQRHVGQAHAREAAAPGERVGAPPGPRGVALETCAPAKVGVSASTDRRLYRAGQSVAITVTVRNDTRSSCAVPTGSCVPQVVIKADNGIVVWNRAELQVVCTYRGWW